MLKQIKYYTVIVALVCVCFPGFSQPRDPNPTLIVGIVVDQMRYDYITRYWDRFEEGGFKKLVNEGYNFSNTHYNYVPTYTGPGHASIYTGTTPAVHGIISNDWYSRKLMRTVYVTDDSTVTGTGTSGIAGKMSPHYMLTTTIGDELRLASNFRSKVIGIALKDRSAILPAGHSANAAYWYESASGNWISSSWYLNSLPEWVVKFNARKLPDAYLKEPWTLLLSPDKYDASTRDSVIYEDLFPGETAPVFPHKLYTAGAVNYDLLKYSPAGITLTKEFALEALKVENLGKDTFTDLLAVSFSSPDYVGHQYGTHAMETEDVYLRLDREVADFISQVEQQVGKEKVVFFLTADHAAIPNVLFLQEHKLPAGIFNIAGTSDTLQKFLAYKFGNQKWILAFDNDQVYLDHNLLNQNKIDYAEMLDVVCGFLMKIDGVAGVLTGKDLENEEYSWGIRSLIQKGFYAKRSGDVAIILEPGLVEYKTKGTTHGSGYAYDTHVPLLFYGAGIPKGSSSRELNITDIAPTLSQILRIQSPSGCTGKVILEIFEKNLEKGK